MLHVCPTIELHTLSISSFHTGKKSGSQDLRMGFPGHRKQCLGLWRSSETFKTHGITPVKSGSLQARQSCGGLQGGALAWVWGLWGWGWGGTCAAGASAPSAASCGNRSERGLPRSSDLQYSLRPEEARRRSRKKGGKPERPLEGGVAWALLL